MGRSIVNHRNNLFSNSNRYILDRNRAIENFANAAYKHYKARSNRKKKRYVFNLLKQLGEMVFEAQSSKPLYEHGIGLPRAWNAPKNWAIDYIKYEIGHLYSKNQGGSDKPENLTFQSARCNQHIQTSMNYHETTEYMYVQEVRERIDNVKKLHQTEEWKDVINKIENLLNNAS